jgi:hypothetical protein
MRLECRPFLACCTLLIVSIVGELRAGELSPGKNLRGSKRPTATPREPEGNTSRRELFELMSYDGDDDEGDDDTEDEYDDDYDAEPVSADVGSIRPDSAPVPESAAPYSFSGAEAAPNQDPSLNWRPGDSDDSPLGSDDELPDGRRWYFGTELMLSWGLSPGNSLIGAAQFSDLNFFPGAPNTFPHQYTGGFTDQFHYGVRARLGWDNPDGSGVMLSAFRVFGKQQELGPGRVFWGSDIYQLQPLASIPLNDGGNGTVVPFDSAFLQQYNQNLFGGDLDAYFTPFVDGPSFQMKFLVGAKYLQISEQFNVQAADSGLGYYVDTTTNTIDYSTVQYVGIPPYEMQLSSSTRSRLAGPAIGVRYDLGNELIKVWGQTKFAVAGNWENTRLSGQNVVNGFQAYSQQGPAFYQTSQTTRVSTIFETSIYADFYFFAMLPVVRKVDFLRRAQFRIGFDYILVGDVERPTNIINYNTPIPTLKGNRTWFDLKTLTLGINWNY